MPGSFQHVIPAFHLAQFADAAGRVWVYSDPEAPPRPDVADRISAEHNFYSSMSAQGQWDNTIDQWITAVEGRGHPVYGNLLQTSTFASAEDYGHFLTYVALFIVRTRPIREEAGRMIGSDFLDHVKQIAENDSDFDASIAKFEKERGRALSPEQKERIRQRSLSPPGTIGITREFTFHVFRGIEPIVEVLETMNWCLLTAEEHSFFITSDNPVCRATPPLREDENGLQHRELEVTLPLSPKHLIIFTHRDGPRGVIANKHIVANINRRTATNEARHLYAHLDSPMVHELNVLRDEERQRAAGLAQPPRVKILRSVKSQTKKAPR